MVSCVTVPESIYYNLLDYVNFVVDQYEPVYVRDDATGLFTIKVRSLYDILGT